MGTPLDRDNANGHTHEPNVRVVAITGGANVPSRRYRIDALVASLAQRNIKLTELCPTISKYPPSSRILRPPWFLLAILERLTYLGRSTGYDAVILQREMISTLPTLERFLPTPRILDVDDSIHLHRKGFTAKFIAQSCSLVVCGNDFLARQYSRWNSNVLVIPTGVDTELLRPKENSDTSGVNPIIGWIGTSGNFRYLEMITPALRKVFEAFPTARLQIIANRSPTFLSFLGERLDFRTWRPGIENDLLPLFTVGIMPLIDSEWEHGKCSFKMLQYMAAGVPVVVSPVGPNEVILQAGSIGYAARNTQEWIDALIGILENRNIGATLGSNGRKLVEREYSLVRISDLWSNALRNRL